MENEEIDIDETLGGFEEDANATPPEEEEEVDFLSRYVEPHTKKSRLVTEADLDRVIKEAHVLYNLCFTIRGLHQGAYACCSPQIDDNDPLQLFVTAEKEIIMNPEIYNHTGHTVDSKEACTTFFDKGLTTVQRWNKMGVLYQIFGKDGKLKTVVENVTGKRSRVFQHEMAHMGLLGDKHYIYDI